MPKPTQAEVAELVGRLRAIAQITDDDRALRHEAADTLEALAEETMPLALIAKQAEDAGLWFKANTAAEAYLQQELRKLHAAIEALAGEGAEPVGYVANKDGLLVGELIRITGLITGAPLYALPPAKPAGELPVLIEQALEAALRWHQGDKYRFSNDEEKRTVWSDHQELLTDALRALRERA